VRLLTSELDYVRRYS